MSWNDSFPSAAARSVPRFSLCATLVADNRSSELLALMLAKAPVQQYTFGFATQSGHPRNWQEETSVALITGQ
jgi:hypothetical protein